MATKRQSLGKGLDALLGIAEDINTDQGFVAGGVKSEDGKLQQLPVELLFNSTHSGSCLRPGKLRNYCW